MSPERFRQVCEIFNAALDVAPDDRATILDDRCQGDAPLRAEVEKMLAAHHRDADNDSNVGLGTSLTPLRLAARDALEDAQREDGERGDSTSLDTESADAALVRPTHIGPYRIIRRIGAGGMGVVYEAEQQRPKRIVALKMMRPDVDAEKLIRRFTLESEVLARLQHPGIARILEAGEVETDQGTTPYFAMELIEGSPLRDFVRERKIQTREVIELLEKIALAVAHAHENGIVHRDLKPDNILVEADGQPRILDFGVARVEDHELRGSFRTTEGQIIGTLAYMSPEQITASGLVDARSDVYSLGVIAYELLANRHPMEISSMSLPDAARRLVEDDPARLGSIDPSLQGDIETIVGATLAKEPGRRYKNASALARDLRRHLDDEPIRARPTTSLYRVRKFAQRHRVGVRASLLVAAILFAGVAFSWKLLNRVKEASRRSEESAAAVIEERAVSERRRDRNAVLAAELFAVSGEYERSRAELEKVPEHARHWEWRHVASLDPSRFIRRAHTARVAKLVFGSEDTRLVSIDEGDRACLWDPADGRLIARFSARGGSVVFRSSGEIFASIDPENGGAVIVRDRETGRELARSNLGARSFTTLASLPTADALLVGDRSGGVGKFEAWDLARLSPLTMGTAPVTGLEVSVDGRVAIGFDDGRVVVVQGASGDEIAARQLTPARAPRLAWAAAGRRLVSRGSVVLDATTLDEVARLEVGAGPRAISADGASIAVTTANALLALHATDDGSQLARSRQKTPGLREIAFSRNGRELYAAVESSGIVAFGTRNLKLSRAETSYSSTISALAISGHGRWLATGSNDGAVAVWEEAALREEAADTALTESDEPILAVAFSTDGERLVTAGRDPSLRVWCVRRRRLLTTFRRQRGDVLSIAVSPRGHLIASGSADGTVCVRSELSGREIAPALVHRGVVPALAFDTSGGALVSASSDGRIRIFRTRDLPSDPGITLVAGPDGDEVTIEWTSLAVSGDVSSDHDEVRIAAADPAGAIWIWTRAPNREWRNTRLEASERVNAVAFSPDGRTLASGGEDAGVTIHEHIDGEPRRRFVDLDASVCSLAFHPQGDRLAAGLVDGSLAVVDTQRAEIVLSIQAHSREVSTVAWSPSGSDLASVSRDGSARVWTSERGDDDPGQREELEREEQRVLEWLTERVASTDDAEGSRRASYRRGQELIERLVLEPGSASLSGTADVGVRVSAAYRCLERLRESPRREWKPRGIDLAAIVNGGDGSSPIGSPAYLGLSVDRGRFLRTRVGGRNRQEEGSNPAPVPDSELIDSVFFLDAPVLAINTKGVRCLFHPGDETTTAAGMIEARAASARWPPFDFGEIGTVPIGLDMKRGQGITFDLHALRAKHGADTVRYFSSVAGEIVTPERPGGVVNAWIVLSDETRVLERVLLYRLSDEGVFVQTWIPPEARFLTLVAGAAMDGNRDRCVFGTPQISAEKFDTTSADELEVLPHWLPLPIRGARFPIRVVGRLRRGSLADVPVAVDVREVRYESSNSDVARVDELGIVTAMGPGTATIRVRVGEFTDEVRVVVEGTR